MTPHDSWGPWRLHLQTYVLYHAAKNYYYVDLEECTTSARVLDRIIQVSKKPWADDATVAGLIRALGDVLSPQRELCSFGTSKHLAKTRIRELARQAHEEQAPAVYPQAEP